MNGTYCGNCKFYENGECRRYPPVHFRFMTDNQTGREESTFTYVTVSPHNPSCGEFVSVRERVVARPNEHGNLNKGYTQ